MPQEPCKFDEFSRCPLKKEPTDLECLACGLRAIAREIHPEDGEYKHVVFIGNEVKVTEVKK